MGTGVDWEPWKIRQWSERKHNHSQCRNLKNYVELIYKSSFYKRQIARPALCGRKETLEQHGFILVNSACKVFEREDLSIITFSIIHFPFFQFNIQSSNPWTLYPVRILFWPTRAASLDVFATGTAFRTPKPGEKQGA
jgi:hypothetical protein